ncbi:hypothetical protein SRB5_11020 [Streptomyces sp. RB5]|uniref:ATP-binding protein n=1 Tax=Streptomyces smaragdinus TaxID=2585196 RepID=A0A7K0CC24_9ACTN|nr:hypothetical protein [Streptomyces smaragdinus]
MIGGAAGPLPGDNPGERLLNRTVRRYGVWLRSAAVLVCGVLGLVSADTGQTPVAVGLLTPAFLACAARLALLRRPRPLAVPWALDAAVVTLTGLSQPALGGAGADMMVEAIVGIAVITFQFEWATRPVPAAALAVTGLAACVLGDVLAAPGRTPEWKDVARIAVLVCLARAAYVIVRARVRAADRAAAAGAAARREADVAAARRASERDYLALLHDTACATLLTVSRGDSRDWSWLPPRARRDLDALSAAPGFETGSVDLAALLACVPEGDGRTKVLLRTDIRGPLTMPSGPGLAIFQGVREAVANVACHAGVREAALGAWTEGRAVVVELSDTGRGFHPESVPSTRRGISRSVIGRMHAVGGSATVVSSPGAGTLVRWRWDDRSWTPRTGDGPGARDVPHPHRERAVVRLMRRQVLHGAQLAVLLICLVSQFAISIRQLTHYQDLYRPAWAQTTAFVWLAAVLVIGATHLPRGRQLPPGVRWWTVASLLAVSATCTFTLPPQWLTGDPDWAFGLIGWHALFLLADVRIRLFTAFLAAHVGLSITVVLALASPTLDELAAAGIATVSTCGFQLSMRVLVGLFRDAAPAAGNAAARAEELRTRERIHEHLQRDHKERYRALTATTVPLLMGLGYESLSPRDEEVRLRCGVEAARMRRLFAEGDAVSDPLLNELRACIEVAERKGVAVGLAIRGRSGEVPVEIRRELIDPVAVVLGHTRSTARVTVVWTARAVRVSVVGADCADSLRTGAARDPKVSVVTTARGDSVWAEASWSSKRPEESNPA